MKKLLPFLFVTFFCATAFGQKYPNLSKPPKMGGGENDAAVVVAIENYAFLPDIKGAEQNGNDWYLHFTRGLNVDPARVTFLKNEEASKEEIIDAVAKMSQLRKPGGKLWFVFIGHGAPNPEADGTGVLIGVDAQQNAKSLIARGVPQTEVLGPLEKATADNPGDAIVVLDACFSGKSGGGDALVPGLQPVLAVPDIKSSVVFLSAARNDEFAGPLPDKSRPAFSYLALGALRGWADSNGDANVSASELTGYVNDSMKVIIKGRTQTANQSAPTPDAPLSVTASEKGPDWIDFVTTNTSGNNGNNTGGNVKKPYQPKKRRLGFANASFRLGFVNMDNFTASGSGEVTGNWDFGGGGIDTQSTSVDVNGSTSDVAPTLIGGQLELLLGDRGFVGGLIVGFGTASDITNVEFSQQGEVFPFPTLEGGVTGDITSLTLIEITPTIGYRLGLGGLSIYPRLGVGAHIMPMQVSFALDGFQNDVSLTALKFAFPVGLEIGYDIIDSVYLSAGANYYVLPAGNLSTKVGVGFYF